MCFFIQSCEPLGGGKKERKKCTSFLHEPCVLPASPSSPLSALLNWQKPASGRLACVGNPNHTTAFLPLSPVGTGEKSCPCFSLPSKLPWEPALTCAAGAGSVGHGLREPAHRLHAIPTASSSPPSRNSPPRVRPPEGLPGLGGWHVFLKQLQKVISHQLPRWVPFFFSSLSKHTCRLATVAFCDCLVLKEQVYLFVVIRAEVALSLLLERTQLFLG